MFKSPNNALKPATGCINGIFVGTLLWVLIVAGIRLLM